MILGQCRLPLTTVSCRVIFAQTLRRQKVAKSSKHPDELAENLGSNEYSYFEGQFWAQPDDIGLFRSQYSQTSEVFGSFLTDAATGLDKKNRQNGETARSRGYTVLETKSSHLKIVGWLVASDLKLLLRSFPGKWECLYIIYIYIYISVYQWMYEKTWVS